MQIITKVIIHQMLQQQENQQQEPSLQISLNLKDQSPPEWLDHPIDKIKKKQSKRMLQPQLTQDPVIQELNSQLERAKKLLTKSVFNIQAKQHEIQYNVYVSETTNNKNEYLKALYKHSAPNDFVKQQIYETVTEANQLIQKDIHHNNLDLNVRKVPKNKQHLQDLENADHYRLLKLKEGEMKSKIGSLRKDLDSESIKSKLKRKIFDLDQEHVGKDYYSIDHPRTKQAQLFIKQVRQKAKEHQQVIQSQLQYKQQMVRQTKEQQQYEKQQQLQQRKTKLQEYYHSKLVQKLEEKEREKQKRQEFQQWIKEYQRERPMELEKEEQYRMKVIIPELEERHKKLMTIRAEHRPIDMQEIAAHQEKYMEFRKDNQLRKRAQMQLQKEEEDMNVEDINQKMFKGKYRYLVLEQMIEEKYPIDSKEIEQSKKDRIKAYNEYLRSYNRNNSKEKGKIQAETVGNQKFVKRVRKMNGSMNITSQHNVEQPSQSEKGDRKISENNHYEQGIKNLEFIKSKVRQEAAKELENPPKINVLEEKEFKKPIDFLQVQRENKDNKKKKISSISKEIQKTAVTANEEIDALRAKAEMLDERVKRKEVKLKNAENGKHQQGHEVEVDYVEAIKAKLHMLNQFD